RAREGPGGAVARIPPAGGLRERADPRVSRAVSAARPVVASRAAREQSSASADAAGPAHVADTPADPIHSATARRQAAAACAPAAGARDTTSPSGPAPATSGSAPSPSPARPRAAGELGG